MRTKKILCVSIFVLGIVALIAACATQTGDEARSAGSVRIVRLCKNPFVYSDYSWVSDHTSAKSVSQRLKISFLVAINTSRARWWS